MANEYKLLVAEQAAQGLGVIDTRRRVRAIAVRQRERQRFLHRHLKGEGVSSKATASCAYCGKGAWVKSNRPAMTRAYPPHWFASRTASFKPLWHDLNPPRVSDQLAPEISGGGCRTRTACLVLDCSEYADTISLMERKPNAALTADTVSIGNSRCSLVGIAGGREEATYTAIEHSSVRESKTHSALINQSHAIVLERGITVPEGRDKPQQYLALGRQVTHRTDTAANRRLSEWLRLDRRIAVFGTHFAAHARGSADAL